MIHLTERHMFNNNNKTVETTLQRHVDPFILILLLSCALVYLFRF